MVNMAWRLNSSVVRGDIDNRERGRVTGLVWLFGREHPVELRLAGNCRRDLAGTHFTFTNPKPEAGDAVDLAPVQDGQVGDITAARKVRDIPEADLEKLAAGRGGAGADTYPLANALYVEWFSGANGRVVIETTKYAVQILERAWTLSAAEEQAQREANRKALVEWLAGVTGQVDAADDDPDEFDFEDYEPMDEFQWEKFMRESDATTDKFSKLFEKYADDPDRERIIAREMGWSWLEEALAEEEAAAPEPADLAEAGEEPPEMVPNPLKEGVDWVRDEHGYVEHPLTLRAHELGLDLWRDAEARGLMEDPAQKDVHEMVFETQTTAAKLAGALNHLAYDEAPEGGFVVAALKRALNHLHQAIAAAERVSAAKAAALEQMPAYGRTLFEIRQEILALMQRFRQAK
ncbi:MAG: hypothetical protein V1873_02350 [Verrucomicrobiota bacterium]